MKSSFFLYSICSSLAAFNHLKDHISHEQEEVWIICLNNLKHAIATEKIFIGTVNRTLIHPREIFKRALLNSSHSIIICHSHPSGDTSPSKEDIEVTKELLKASKFMQIPLIDHLIFTRNNYFSFLDHRLI